MFNLSGTSQPQASTGFTFGTTSTAPSFGTGQTGLGTGFGQPTTTTSFSFAQPTAPSFNFGQPVTSTPSLGLTTTSMQPQTSSLFALPTAPQINLTSTVTPTTTSVVNRGLGGEGALSESTSSSNRSPKDQPLPPEIKAVVENFRTFLKELKTIRDENGQEKYSLQPIVNISNELDDGIRVQLERLDVVLQRNAKTVENLKKETSNLFEDGENACRGIKQEASLSSDFGGFMGSNRFLASPALNTFFVKFVKEFEETMTSYAKQIQELQIHLDNMNKPVNSQELFTVIRRQHDSLVSLAAEIYAIHEQIGKFQVDPKYLSSPSNGRVSLPSSSLLHKNINLIREGEKKTVTDKQVTKPIAFPTFSFDKKNTTQETTVSTVGLTSPGVTATNSLFTQSLIYPGSASNLLVSPSSQTVGNMSFGSPVMTPFSQNTSFQSPPPFSSI